MAFITTTAASISSGGTINGDLTVTGDFKVEGAGSFTYDEIIEGSLQVNAGISFSGASYLQDVGNNYLKLRIANGDYFAIHGGASDTEYFRLTNDGKVGIGTSSPSSNLHIKDASSYTQLKIESGSVNQQTYLTMEADRPAENDIIANIQFTSAGSLAGDIKYFRGSSDANGSFKFGTGSSGGTRFVLDDNSRISLSNNDSGTSNTIFGKSIGTIDAGTNYNTFIGDQIAGSGTLSDASDNTALGYYVLNTLTEGDNNVGIGSTTMQFNTTGGTNTGVGMSALRYNSTGSNDTAVGTYSQRGVSGNSHSNNTSVGASSLYSITTGGNNVAIGKGALYKNSSASHNVAIGLNACLEITTGDKNVAIGSYAMSMNHDGNPRESKESVFIGYNSGGGTWANNQSHYNTAVGAWTMDSALDGALYNTALGYIALSSITTADNNVALGTGSLQELTTGEGNIAIGRASMNVHGTGSWNTAIGSFAMDDTDAG